VIFELYKPDGRTEDVHI